MASLLDPSVVPSLRHFSLVDCSDESAQQLKQSLSTDLLHQLETIYLHRRIWLNPRLSFLHSAAERTLVYGFPDQLSGLMTAPTRNLFVRLYNPPLEDLWSSIDHHLARITTTLKMNPSLPRRSLYLPSFLRPTSSLPCKMSEAVSKLVATCEERKIDLVFEDFPSDARLDGYISKEFIRRQAIYRSRDT
ncbi:hypothetical protein JCM5350_000255 [Sporobolomyces pararoseus]